MFGKLIERNWLDGRDSIETLISRPGEKNRDTKQKTESDEAGIGPFRESKVVLIILAYRTGQGLLFWTLIYDHSIPAI